MPNSYFQFKQFIIHQERCAMKVCTDACLFGAWVANELHNLEEGRNISMLDIGSGTGLLSLMLAQKINGTIDTIEIDENASQQAKENIAQSKWNSRLHVIQGDVKLFDFKNKKYNLIISNPPFYENDLRSTVPAANLAKHDETLTLEDLIALASLHLAHDGFFALLLPFHRTAYAKRLAAAVKLFPFSQMLVRQSSNHAYFRSMIIFRKQLPVKAVEDEMMIKDGVHYTPLFVTLLKDYYLNF